VNLPALGARIKILITRRTRWVDEEYPDDVTIHRESWRTAWAIAGIHSYHWWWVRRYGKLPCGCTRNPLTRRLVLYRWRCEVHP